MRRVSSLAVVVLLSLRAYGGIRLPAVIGDHAMFQAGKPVAIWGWAAPLQKVKVAFIPAGDGPAQSFSAAADERGKWSGTLSPLKSGTDG